MYGKPKHRKKANYHKEFDRIGKHIHLINNRIFIFDNGRSAKLAGDFVCITVLGNKPPFPIRKLIVCVCAGILFGFDHIAVQIHEIDRCGCGQQNRIAVCNGKYISPGCVGADTADLFSIFINTNFLRRAYIQAIKMIHSKPGDRKICRSGNDET